MAQILPMSTDLSDDMEGSSIDVYFTAQLEQDETLVSINIISYDPTPGINVDGNHLYGTYESVFSFGGDALKYRIGDEFKSAGAWEDLPTDKSTQLYLWKAPDNLRRVFNYEVELIYDVQPPAPEPPPGGSKAANEGGTLPPEPVRKTLTKSYFKTIVGNWSKWAQQLRAYVYERP